MKPFIGCIPTPSAVRNTTAASSTPVGPPLDLRFASLQVKPGLQRVVMLWSPAGETLVDSWNATAFTTAKPPAPGLAGAIQVQTRLVGARVQMSISVSEALRAGAGPARYSSA